MHGTFPCIAREVLNVRENLEGRIGNVSLPKRAYLRPLHEAIINSVHAIQERCPGDGRIEIEVLREPIQTGFDGSAQLPSVTGFVVSDNGIGFSDKHYESFGTADSTLKAAMGGKGVGRFIWLKAFSHVHIESTYGEPSCLRHREFDFQVTEDGIENLQDTEAAPGAEHRTVVSLTGYKRKYKEECPKSLEVIARRVVEHFLEHFLFDRQLPDILLKDSATSEEIVLRGIFDRDFDTSQTDEITVKKHSFSLQHVLMVSPHDRHHYLHYCGHRMVVTSTRLGNDNIPHMDEPLHDDDTGDRFYAGYVSSSYLNENISPERTDFTIGDGASGPMFDGDPGFQDIEQGVLVAAKSFLAPRTARTREVALLRVRDYVEQKQPEYRYLLERYGERIGDLSPHLPEERIEEELHRMEFETTQRVRREASEALAVEESATEDWQQFQERMRRVLGDLSDLNKSELARYVRDRKIALDYLEQALNRRPDGSYPPEEAIHDLVFPRRHTSDEVRFADHNLWMLDERLVYHRYLASDVPFSAQDAAPVEVHSQKRCDLVIYDTPSALVEEDDAPFRSVTIFEFKRPERDNYPDKRDPIAQVRDYVRDIRAGTAKDIHGRTIPVPENAPFYCYVVATLTPRLKHWAEDSDMTPAPDGLGYFVYHSQLKAYIEVISFDKLLADARKRNQAFFRRLGLA